MIQQMKKWLAEAAQSLHNAGKSLASPKKKAEMALEEAREKVAAGSSHIPLFMAEQTFSWGQYERCIKICKELF
jgi:HEPN domain-containing protein